MSVLVDTMNAKLQGKTALVTGGTSGIGLASAKLFVQHGARVLVTGRDPVGLERAQEELGGDAMVLRSDAGEVSEIDSLMRCAKENLGQLDVLFLNAAVAIPVPFELVSEQQFDQSMAINLKGVFFTIQKALPLMSGNASIIATTSIANRKASAPFSVYGASKAALRSLVLSLSPMLIERGIRFNAISPGPIDTPMFDRFGLPEEMVEARKREMRAKSPIKRFGTPEEVAKVALFLASDDSSYMTGDEIVVDGGMSLI